MDVPRKTTRRRSSYNARSYYVFVRTKSIPRNAPGADNARHHYPRTVRRTVVIVYTFSKTVESFVKYTSIYRAGDKSDTQRRRRR